MRNRTTNYTIEEINAISGHPKVTHAMLKYDIPPTIGTLFPHLTHLKLHRVGRISDCARYNIIII